MSSPYTLNVNVQIQPAGTLINTIDWATAVDNAGKYQANPVVLSTGSGVSQANTWAVISSSVPASGHWDVDLTSVSNLFGSVNFSKVKVLLFTLDNPDGAGALYLNVTPTPGNSFVGVPTGTELFTDNYYKENPFQGWGVSGGASGIRFSNPTASAAHVSGWVAGIM